MTMAIGFNEIQVEETALGEIVILVIKGKLSKEDYDAFVPQLDWLIEKRGSIKLLVELVDFQGWTAGALWEDTKFALKHMRRHQQVGAGRRWQTMGKRDDPVHEAFYQSKNSIFRVRAKKRTPKHGW
jgi:hypothetical protein